jgi:phage shock protein PspC (stress-responsive transcriptional regulator)
MSLRLNKERNVLGGVCAGLADSTGMETWAWRLLFTLAFFFGPGLLIYLLMWIFVPKQA